MTYNQKEIAVDRSIPWQPVTALVTDNKDPEGQGRVKIQIPWSPDEEGGVYEAWARLATLMAGSGRGTWFQPDIGDEVLVTFMEGDPDRPVVIGALWNGQDAPPETMDNDNTIKSIVSRQGIRITLDDSSRSASLTLETPAGQRIEIKDGSPAIEISDSSGNSIRLEPSGISITASANVTVSGSAVEVNAGLLTVNSGLAKFSGVVQANTVIANSVIAATYTPGAGNVS